MTSRIEKMVQYAVDYANDDSHGYSQEMYQRWGQDRDCVTLIYDAATYAGYDVGWGPGGLRYTGTVIDDFTAAGFECLRYGSVPAQRGDIFVRDPWGKGGHAELYIGDGNDVGAHIAETGGIYGQPGDQTGNEISIAPNPGGWDFILRPPADPEPEQVPGKPINDAGMRYRAHVQNLGWLAWVRDGQTAGTEGFGLRLECLTVQPPAGVELRIKLHEQNRGWVTYPVATHDKPQSCGTTGQAMRIEAIIIEAVKLPKGKRLQYRVHQQNVGWKSWTDEGYATGSDGQAMRLEAIQIRLVG